MNTLMETLDALYDLVAPHHRLTVRWLSIEYARLQLAAVAPAGSDHDASLDLLGEIAGALRALADPYVSVDIDEA